MVEQAGRARAEQQLQVMRNQMNTNDLAPESPFQSKSRQQALRGSSSSNSPNRPCQFCQCQQFSSFREESVSAVDVVKSRVMEYAALERWLLVSCQLPSGRWGLRRVSILNASAHRDDIDIGHTDAIRDLKLNPRERTQILTVSTDRSFRLSNIQSKNCVLTISQPDSAIWSCCWDPVRPTYCYAGTQTGPILIFGPFAFLSQRSEPVLSFFFFFCFLLRVFQLFVFRFVFFFFFFFFVCGGLTSLLNRHEADEASSSASDTNAFRTNTFDIFRVVISARNRAATFNGVDGRYL